jgi:hypothetical protein
MVYWRMRARTTVVAGAMGKVWRYAGGRLGGFLRSGTCRKGAKGTRTNKKDTLGGA